MGKFFGVETFLTKLFSPVKGDLFFRATGSSCNKGKIQGYFKPAGERMFAGTDEPLFKRAAELRGHLTHTEEILWRYLRTKPLGFKFRRQHPFLNYILDFYCHQLKLVIEVNGTHHQKEEVKRNDEAREGHFKDHGLSILPFTNEQLRTNPEEVICQLEKRLSVNAKLKIEKSHPPKSPL